MFCGFSKNIYLKKFSKQIEKEHVTNVQFKNTLSMESMEMRTPNMIFQGIFQLLNNPWTYPEAYIALFLYISILHLISKVFCFSTGQNCDSVEHKLFSRLIFWSTHDHDSTSVLLWLGPWPLPAVYS